MEQTLGKQNFQKIFQIGFLSIGASACMAPAPNESNPQNTICEVEKISVERGFSKKWSDTIELPATGRFYQEGHLATEEDHWEHKSGAQRNFPQHKTEEIDGHLERSARILGVSTEQLFSNKWAKLWTPAEGGRAGQGSIGDKKPSTHEEMFIFNMMFQKSSRPPAGERWLMSYENQYVVVVGGYEVGPSTQGRLGGVQTEVLHTLNAPYGSAELTIHGPLKDQSLNPGKINCSDIQYITK